MTGIAFCGLKHPHVFDLIRLARENGDVRIIGAFEPEPLYAEKAAGDFGNRFYDSYEQLLSDDTVDVVAIGDAYGKRGREAITALKAGKHVLSDKPLCTRPEELSEIRRLSEENRLAVGCMLDLRYDPALRLAAKLISEGVIGEIHAINFSGQHPLNYGTRAEWYFDKESHGGTFNDLIIHGIDAVSYITGLKKLEVLRARGYNAFAVKEPEFRDCAQMMGKYENGAGVIADVSYSAPAGSAFSLPSYWRFSFWGKNGMIECALRSGSVMLAEANKPIRTVAAEPVNENCLSDLIKMIRGESTSFSRESIFDSTRTAQMIQKKADFESCIQNGEHI